MQTAKNPLRISQGSIDLDDIISDLNESESTSVHSMAQDSYDHSRVKTQAQDLSDDRQGMSVFQRIKAEVEESKKTSIGSKQGYQSRVTQQQ
jgi:hypothetical protein